MKTIIEDVNQKKGKHVLKNEYWESQGVAVERCHLPWGDYIAAPKVAVDTKQDIVEITTNMCGSMNEKRRFREECKGAQAAGCKLVFLIEDKRYNQIGDLYGEKVWLHTGQIIPGDQVARAMETMAARYGCEFRFCRPEDAGRIVEEILNDE